MATERGYDARRPIPGIVWWFGLVLGLGFSVTATAYIVYRGSALLMLAGIFGLAGGVAMLAWPDLATLAVIFTLYTNAAVVAHFFHGVPYLIAASVPVALIIPMATYLLFRRQKLIIHPALPLLILFLIVQVIGALLSEDSQVGADSVIGFLIEGLGMYVLITNVIRTPAMLRRVIWVLLAAGAFMGGLTFYQEVTHTYNNNYGGFAQKSNAAFGTGEETVQGEVLQPRLAGPLGEQNRYAQVLMMLVPLGLFRVWGERSHWLRLLAAVATLLISLGIALTFSRGAAVAYAMMIVFMTIMRYIRLRQLLLVVGVGVLLLMAVPEYQTRLLSLEAITGGASGGSGLEAADGSIRSRYTEGMAAALIFVDHPVFGAGPGMYRYLYRRYADIVGLRVLASDRQAHSLYLGLAAETGALGLLTFFGAVFITLLNLDRTRRRWRESRPDLASIATGFLFAIVSYLMTGLFLHLAFIRYFFLMLALAGSASYVADEVELAASHPSKEDR